MPCRQQAAVKPIPPHTPSPPTRVPERVLLQLLQLLGPQCHQLLALLHLEPQRAHLGRQRIVPRLGCCCLRLQGGRLRQQLLPLLQRQGSGMPLRLTLCMAQRAGCHGLTSHTGVGGCGAGPAEMPPHLVPLLPRQGELVCSSALGQLKGVLRLMLQLLLQPRHLQCERRRSRARPEAASDASCAAGLQEHAQLQGSCIAELAACTHLLLQLLLGALALLLQQLLQGAPLLAGLLLRR